jgi:hypothetical protein
MAPEPLLSSLCRWLKMNLLSLLSAILVIRRRRGLVVVEPLLEGGVNVVDGRIPEAGEDNSRELEDEVANKVTTTIMTGEGEVVLVVGGDLAGKITTSPNEIAMRLLTSSRTGRCWRRLISIVWLS